MPNPKPTRTEEFRQYNYKPAGEVPGKLPLAKRPTSIKLPVDVDEAIRGMSEADRVTWLRRVICNAAQSELLTAN